MKTKLFLLLFFAMAVAIAGEALPVSGSVRDPQGRAVPGATVALYSRTSNAVLKTTTDSGGAYRFEGVAAGDYLLRAEAPGFAARLLENFHVAAPMTEDIALQLAGVREQVVVTAAGTPQGPEEVLKTVTVIDAAEAQQRDVFALTEIGTAS